MHSLLIVAHGSRRAASNEEVRALTAQIAAQAGGRYGSVSCAFLELAEPSIPAGLESCVAQGARQITVLPYFLSAGRHVAEDIPNEVAATQTAHPDIDIRIAPYLGASPAISELMLTLAG